MPEREQLINAAIAANRQEWNRTRGHLFGAAESFGLPESHEHGMKGIIRNTTYAGQNSVESVLRELHVLLT